MVYLYAADLVLKQTTQPAVTNVEGELATAPTLSGTADLAFHAEDTGSGVYEAVFTVDGVEAGRVVLDENAGHCRDAGQTTDGLPAFLYLRPCAPSLTADVPFDTTGLTDGTHHLVVSVADAAGNRMVALDRRVAVSNHPRAPSPGSPLPQLGGANGTNASAGARLRVRWSATARASLTGAYGHAQTVLGRLTAPGGAPIAGALLQVLGTPSYGGARPCVLGSPRTAADGSFRLRLSRSMPSSRLTFAYASHVGQAVPDVTATLALAVGARLSLGVTPHVSHVGGTIAFSGTLSGAPLPSGGKQLVLEARTPAGPWRQFQVLATNRHGRYRASYRFRLAGPITYEFRAVCPHEADFPFATGASNVVRVRER